MTIVAIGRPAAKTIRGCRGLTTKCQSRLAAHPSPTNPDFKIPRPSKLWLPLGA
jgi:hypothetical protein